MAHKTSRIIGCLEISAAAIILGSDGVYVNLIPMSTYALTFFRVSIGTVAILIGILVSGRWDLLRPNRQLRSLLAVGTISAFGWILLFESMKLIPIAEAVFLNYLAPIFVIILAHVFLKEKIQEKILLPLALSFVGIYLMIYSSGRFQFTTTHMIGYVVGALSGLAYAIFIIFSKKTLVFVSRYTLVFYSNLFASILLLPLIVTVPLTVTGASWAMLIALGTVNTAFAVSLYFGGLKRVKAQEAGILAYLEPVSAALLGRLFLHQQLTPFAILGGSLVIVSGALITIQAA